MTPPIMVNENINYDQIKNTYPSNVQTEFTKNIEMYIPLIQKSILDNLEQLFDEKFEEMYHKLKKEHNDTKVIVIEEISKEEAKEKIKKFFAENKGDFYPSDITEKLHIDYDMVWDILEELEKEGIIEEGA